MHQPEQITYNIKTMHIELKKAIVNWMFEHKNEFQLTNATREQFRQYIYTPEGNHIIGGEEVSEFISSVNKNIIHFEQNFKPEKS